MNENIEKINIKNINRKYNPSNNTISLPDIETIYRITKDNPSELVNELLRFESIIIDQHREIEELKNYEQKFEHLRKENLDLKQSIEKYKVQATFYKSAYSSIMASSTFTHLQDVEGSIIKEHGIKESLIKMNNDLDMNLSLKQLNVLFNSIESDYKLKKIRERNMEIIHDKFDL